MKPRVLVTGSVVSVTVAVLAGCTTGVAGTAVPDSADPTASESTVPTSEPDTYGAPRVDDPLDASRFLTDPCAVLTRAQLTGFGVSKPGEPDTDSAIAVHSGPGCVWVAESEVNSVIGASFLSGNKNGLSDTYRGRDRFDGYFEPTTVDGYPAVFNDIGDGRPQGDCNITVGISDTLTFRAAEHGGRDAQGACDRATQVAAAVIQTIKGG